MEGLIAFVSGGDAYVLPRFAGAAGVVLVNQPRFIPYKQVQHLQELKPEGEVASWVEKCQKAPMLRGFVDLQRIYCWWMSLSQYQRDSYFSVP